MSFLGVPYKQPAQPLRASDWNLLVQAVDTLYAITFYQSAVLFGGVSNIYVAGIVDLDGAYFGDEIYVKGLKVLHDQDPIYIASFLSQAQQQLYQYISAYLIQVDQDIKSVYTQLLSVGQVVGQIKLYATPSAVASFVLPVLSTAAPLVSSRTPIKRAYLFVTADTPYVVYVGGVSGQHYPIPPGGSLTLDVCDAYLIWLRSQNYSYVRVLLEQLSQPVC
ncbi:MAG: hypothetical protein ACP5MH_11185 [Thermoproteus sp.]